MTTLACHQFSVLDAAGNVVPGAHIEVRAETAGTPLASLFADRDGLTPLGNPFDADADGFAQFFVAGGSYQIWAYTGTSGSPTFEAPLQRYVGIGLASESDGDSSARVDTIAGNTGDFTLSGGVEISGNDIRLDGTFTGWGVANCSLAASVSSNLLTVAIKDASGADPSSDSPCLFSYRHATASNGTTELVKQSSALSISTYATGASLGSTANKAFRLWVVVFNDGGSNVPALINCSTASGIFPLTDGAIASSTAISGSATSAGVFYTPHGTTVTNKPYRILGFIEYNSTGLATPGTYASAPNIVQNFGPGIKKPGDLVQSVYYSTTTEGTATGVSYATLTNTPSAAITPTSAVNPVKARAAGVGVNNSSATSQMKMQRTIGGTPTQIGPAFSSNASNGAQQQVVIDVLDTPNSTAAVTYNFVGKISAGTWRFPASSSSADIGMTMFLDEIMG